jgi:hypothetical protein
VLRAMTSQVLAHGVLLACNVEKQLKTNVSLFVHTFFVEA